MIQRLITFLTAEPTPSTSPLGVALANVDLVTAMGDADKVNLVDTRDQEGNAPYVRLWQTPEITQTASFMGGFSKRAWEETQVMQIEYAAKGPTPAVASDRADYLQMIVEGAIQQYIGSITPDVLEMNDIGGTGSIDQIKRIIPVGARPARAPMGPGTLEDPDWTVTRLSRYEVWVYKERRKIL